jgi:hypothetical protein
MEYFAGGSSIDVVNEMIIEEGRIAAVCREGNASTYHNDVRRRKDNCHVVG